MPAQWTDVESSQDYQSLNDEEKKQVQQRYFDNVVAVDKSYIDLPDEEKAQVQQKFEMTVNRKPADANLLQDADVQESMANDPQAQLNKGLAEGPLGKIALSAAKGINSLFPGGNKQNARFDEQLANTPDAKGVGSSLARAIGQAGEGLAVQAPLMMAAGPGGLGLGAIRSAALSGGIYGAGRSALIGEGNPLIEGALNAGGNAAFMGAANLGGKLVPSQVDRLVPGVSEFGHKLGNVIGGMGANEGMNALGQAISGQQIPEQDVNAGRIMTAGMSFLGAGRRQTPISQQVKDANIDMAIKETMAKWNITPELKGTAKTNTKLFNEQKQTMANGLVTMWENGKKFFTGENGKAANMQEIVNANDATVKSNADFIDSLRSEPIAIRVPKKKTIQVIAKDGRFVDKQVTELDSNGFPVYETQVAPAEKLFKLPGSEVVARLWKEINKEKKGMELSRVHDPEAILKYVETIKNKTYSLHDVNDVAVPELNKTFMKDNKNAKLDYILAKTLRDLTEEKLNMIDGKLKGDLGARFRQARKELGGSLALKSRLAKLYAKYGDVPIEQKSSLTDNFTKLVDVAQAGMGALTHNPAQTALGTMDLVNRYSRLGNSKHPVESFNALFKTLDKIQAEKTLNQMMSEKAMVAGFGVKNSFSQPNKNINPAVVAGLSSLAAAGLGEKESLAGEKDLNDSQNKAFEHLLKYEGSKSEIYPDPGSGSAIGYGHRFTNNNKPTKNDITKLKKELTDIGINYLTGKEGKISLDKENQKKLAKYDYLIRRTEMDKLYGSAPEDVKDVMATVKYGWSPKGFEKNFGAYIKNNDIKGLSKKLRQIGNKKYKENLKGLKTRYYEAASMLDNL